MTLVIVTSASPETRYNVLYLILDDLRPEFLTAYDQKQMITPHIDALANSSLVFSHAYASVAVCCASRNSFMTGRRPHHTLVFDNQDYFPTPGGDFRSNGQGENWTTMPEHFMRSNWTTWGGGKTFHPKHPPNFDEPRSWTPGRNYFPFHSHLVAKKGDPACPGIGKVTPPWAPRPGLVSDIDTWCAVPAVPDDEFYDDTLASDTIDRIVDASKLPNPWFLMSGFARPHGG